MENPIITKQPFCQCLHEIENKLPRTKHCFMPCADQQDILKQKEKPNKILIVDEPTSDINKTMIAEIKNKVGEDVIMVSLDDIKKENINDIFGMQKIVIKAPPPLAEIQGYDKPITRRDRRKAERENKKRKH